MTDGSKGRQADTEGDSKHTSAVSISAGASSFAAVAETALVRFNARQSRSPEDKMEEDQELLAES